MGLMNMYILHKIIDIYILGKKNPGRIINENTLHIIWGTLMRPKPSFLNLSQLPVNLLFPPNKDEKFKPGFIISRVVKLFKNK